MVKKLRRAKAEIETKSQELETLANFDPLTLCLNRRSLAKKFDPLFTRAKAGGAHLSCLMLDIDFFKSVNDNYGHATGDQVIKAVADALKTSTRDTDLVGRYGGEEFCVVLPDLFLDKAVEIAARIRQVIEKKPCSGVNVSGIQLRQQNLANRIRNILDEFNIDTDLLEIELTESALVDTHDGSFAVLEQINSMGLRVSMDDFGSGYSSLSCLSDIPLSCIKIDRSFVSDINKDNNSDKLIASIISIAHGLGLKVVAEGVEKKHQADHLTAIGCEYLQGFYFGRPMPQREVADILQKQPMALGAGRLTNWFQRKRQAVLRKTENISIFAHSLPLN